MKKRPGNWVDKRDWTEHKLDSEKRDEELLIARLLSFKDRVVLPQGTAERTIGELMLNALNDNRQTDPLVEQNYAFHHLLRLGIKPGDDGAYIWIAERSNAELERVFRGPQWEKNWRSAVERPEGAQRGHTQIFASGRPQKAIGIPLPTLFSPKRELGVRSAGG